MIRFEEAGAQISPAACSSPRRRHAQPKPLAAELPFENQDSSLQRRAIPVRYPPGARRRSCRTDVMCTAQVPCGRDLPELPSDGWRCGTPLTPSQQEDLSWLLYLGNATQHVFLPTAAGRLHRDSAAFSWNNGVLASDDLRADQMPSLHRMPTYQCPVSSYFPKS